MDAVVVAVEEFDDSEDVGVGLVERLDDFVAGDGYGRCAGDAAFDFEEAEAAGGGIAAFDVVAAFFELAVGGFVAQAAFDGHYDLPGAGGGGLGVGGCGRRAGRRFACHGAEQAEGRDQGGAEYDGRTG